MKPLSPNTKSGNVQRDHLTPSEIKRLITAAKKSNLNPGRNSTLILIMYRYGLRRSEAANLRWSDIDLIDGFLIFLKKHGKSEELKFVKQCRNRVVSYFNYEYDGSEHECCGLYDLES